MKPTSPTTTAQEGGRTLDAASIPDDHPLHMLAHLLRREDLSASGGYITLCFLFVTSNLIRGRFAPLLRHLGLYEAKLGVLLVLHAFDPESVNQTDLAACSQISPASATDIMRALVAENRVTLHSDPLDAHTLRVRLTNEGRDLLNTTVRPMLTALERCTFGLPAAPGHPRSHA